MLPKMRFVWALAFGLFAGGFASAHQSVGQVFVFGDSLSDTGNAAIISGQNLPSPFFENRQSNGPVLVDVLADDFELVLSPSFAGGTNYAVAGARAGGVTIADLGFQVQSFISHYPEGAPEDGLYVLMIGGNDVRDARDEMSLIAAQAIINGAVEGIGNAVRALLTHGVKKLVVINAPDIGSVPETHLIAAQVGDWIVAAATAKTLKFNSQLYWQIVQIQWQEHARIKQFNLFHEFREVLEEADEYGLENVTDACFNPYVFPFEYRPDCDFEKFAFFDVVHPTAKVHAVLGRELARFVKKPVRYRRHFASYQH